MLKIPKTIKNHIYCFVLAAGLLIAMAATTNAITFREDFEAGYFDGAELQYHLGWFQTRSGTLTDIGQSNGVNSSHGLTKGNQPFIWIAHPFSWWQLSVDESIILQMDFETDASAHFDDDRLGWITKDDDSASANIFGVQLDPGGGGYNIEGYWRNSSGDRIYKSIVTLPSLTSNTWYRLEGEFTKKSSTSTRIDVKLWALSDLVNPIATGYIADTSTISPETDRPDTKYFTAPTVWPVFKNFKDINGDADNAYFQIEDGLDDVADVEVTTNSATEGGATGSFRLKLKTQPSSNVDITCDPYINGGDIDLGSGAGVSVTKTFTSETWETWQAVTVTAYNDSEMEAPEVAWIDFSISSEDDDFDGHYVAPSPVKVKITDNETDAFEAGPYLIYTGVNTEMMVLWQLDAARTCTLKWSEEEDLDPLTGIDDNINKVPNSDNLYREKITNLSTETKYYYEVSYTVDSTTYKANGSFYTPPTGDNLKFLAYGDTRGNGGDPAYGHEPVSWGIMDTLAIDPGYQTFLLHVADWVQNGSDETDWKDNYFNRDFPNARKMLANLPVMGCTGNHEFNSSMSTLFPDYWPYDEIYWPGATKHMYYYFDYGPVRVVVADQYAEGTWYPSGTPGPTNPRTNRMQDTLDDEGEQLDWIKDTLSGSPKTWNFIIFHQPKYSPGYDLSGDDYCNQLEAEMDELFVNNNHNRNINSYVDVVFVGHKHWYSRCLEIDSNVRHITTGGGGAPLRTPGSSGNTKKKKETFNFCEVDIRDNVLYLIARNREGYICDAFALAKDGIPETWSFIVKDSSGNAVAWFDNLGNLALKGDLDEESTHTANGSNDEFRVQDSGSNDIAIIDSTNGNMYIDGFLHQEQDMSLLSPEGFIVKNISGDAVAFIDNSGNVYLQGALFDFPD